MMNFILPVGLLLVSTPFATAKDFLETSSDVATDMSDMLSYLLSSEGDGSPDLSLAVRDQHGKDSHAKNQAGLQSMFKSLPKNEKDNLELPAARYALHRLFEQRHRWFVRGLHPNEEKKGKASTDVVGKALQMLTAVDKKGLTLPGLAALAGTLEQLINKEAASQLDSFFKHNGHSVEDPISGETVAQIVESYMIIYISGALFKKDQKEDIKSDDVFMNEHTKDWTETKLWVKSTMMDAAKTEGGCKNQLSDCQFPFDATVRILKAVVEKYGFYNDGQCHQVKGKLLEMQEHRSGRVTLAEFYKAGLSGAWDFNEKIDYLRSLGALDETTKDNPKVIVANYVSSWVNCLSPSKFYAVCCRNECEDYMQVFEKHVSGANADPDQIIRLVETESVFTRERAPPNLSALRHRLVSVAERHRGKVPIHGRLFAQWMHHAFPSTCPYPHESGTTNPQTPDEWITETGHSDVKASEEEVQKVMTQSKENVMVSVSGVSPDGPVQAGELPWTDVEELLVVRATMAPESGPSFANKIIVAMEGLMVVWAMRINSFLCTELFTCASRPVCSVCV